MRQSSLTDEEADFLNRTRVPVRFAGPVTVLFDDKTEPEQIPVVQIDASNRPDIADLARVTRIEGIQRKGQLPPYRYTTGKDNAAMITSVTLTDPVDCTFTFVLGWPAYKEFFTLAVDREFFYLTAGDIDQVLRNSIGLTIFQTELAEVIQHWQAES